ncbi:FAD-dependent oxidoreductase [Halomonas sediminis]
MKKLVLVGAGHAHAFVLEAFAERPDAGIELTLISDRPKAAYSGCVPAWLAGECSLEEAQIDIAALCERAGARLIVEPAVAIDGANRHVTLAGGEKINFDIASLNVGSTLERPAQQSDSPPYLLAMRPLNELQRRWQDLLETVQAWPGGTERRVLGVGGGAAGCETLMSVLTQLRSQRPDIIWRGTLMSAGKQPLPEAGRLPRALVRRALKQAGVTWQGNSRGEALVKGAVRDHQGRQHPADIVLWATGAVGHGWLVASDLPLDKKGFIKVENTLTVSGMPQLFAAGDCTAFDPPLPNAGVYAVRMGPPLAENLRHACHGQALKPWQPPRRVLALIGTGDGRAIASRGFIGFSGRWVWRWKKRIDARFIARFNRPF